MFRVATIFTLITACFVFSGCPKKDKKADKPTADKKDEKKADDKKADDKKADDKKADDKKADDKKAGGDVKLPDNIKGVASCEALLEGLQLLHWQAAGCLQGRCPEGHGDDDQGVGQGPEGQPRGWLQGRRRRSEEDGRQPGHEEVLGRLPAQIGLALSDLSCGASCGCEAPPFLVPRHRDRTY
jgi:hypothetical protein